MEKDGSEKKIEKKGLKDENVEKGSIKGERKCSGRKGNKIGKRWERKDKSRGKRWVRNEASERRKVLGKVGGIRSEGNAEERMKDQKGGNAEEDSVDQRDGNAGDGKTRGDENVGFFPC